MPAAIRIPEMRIDGAAPPVRTVGPDALNEFMQRHRRLLVLTGAGCSTRSGIPAYRDGEGRWLQRRRPVLYQDFIRCARTRQRYWARSFRGWPVMSAALPNPGHDALAALENAGRIATVITQNVDGLHRRAGQRALIELHGRLDRVACLDCGHTDSRDALQMQLGELNPDWTARMSSVNADGDAELDAESWHDFRPADCLQCNGRLKPEVVFFGETLPSSARERASSAIATADAVLVVGSSLVVGSAYRLVREAAALSLPVAAINQGRTRADELLEFKVDGDCDQVLVQAAASMLGKRPSASASK